MFCQLKTQLVVPECSEEKSQIVLENAKCYIFWTKNAHSGHYYLCL